MIQLLRAHFSPIGCPNYILHTFLISTSLFAFCLYDPLLVSHDSTTLQQVQCIAGSRSTMHIVAPGCIRYFPKQLGDNISSSIQLSRISGSELLAGIPKAMSRRNRNISAAACRLDDLESFEDGGSKSLNSALKEASDVDF